ncbi:MAG: flagellar FliJ family protein [Phycisphaeraceae bacterium]|nr:flagellar FliJ family protein [Phycisphaeraceae bacterium]
MSPAPRPFESVLRVRRHTELRVAVALAEQERMKLAAEEAIRAAGARIEAAQEELRDALEGRLDSATLRLTAHAALIEERHRRRATQALFSMAPALQHARAVLAAASADRRAVELLRERRQREEVARRERSEQASLDEIAARCTGEWA